MSELLSIEGIGTLLMLIFLQAVLGFDNLLYISIESKRVPLERQQSVRRWGIGLAALGESAEARCVHQPLRSRVRTL